MRPTPSQARLLKAMMERPDHVLCVWFGQVSFIARERITEGAWPKGETSDVKRPLAMACVRLGWLQRLKVLSGYEEGYYDLTDEGRQAIATLPPRAFVSRNGKPRPSVRGETAKVLRALAARHNPERGWVFMLEAPMDLGGFDGLHAVDAWAINTFVSRGHKRVGYEVKVSRADWLKEMAHPEKAGYGAWFCDEFYFACPAGLIRPAEVPEPYGLVWASEEGRARMKKRSQLPRHEPTWALVGRLLRRATQE